MRLSTLVLLYSGTLHVFSSGSRHRNTAKRQCLVTIALHRVPLVCTNWKQTSYSGPPLHHSEIKLTAAIRLSDAEVLGSHLHFPGFYPTGTEHRTSFHYFPFFSSLLFSFFPTSFSLFSSIFDPPFIYFFVPFWE